MTTTPRAQKLTTTTSGHAGMTFDMAWNAGIWMHAGSVIGPEHRSPKGLAPREDAYGAAPTKDQAVLVAAVADGVGSSRNSHVASQLAVEATLSVLQHATVANLAAFSNDTVQWKRTALQVMEAVSAELDEELVAERAGCTDRAMPAGGRARGSAPATTLVLALAAVFGDVAQAVWCSVGDSEVAVLQPDAVSWQTNPQDRDHGTRSLPRDTHHLEVGCCSLQPGDALLLMTDGCERVLTLAPEAHSLLRTIVDNPHDPVPLMQVLHRYPSGAADDRTLLMLTNGSIG